MAALIVALCLLALIRYAQIIRRIHTTPRLESQAAVTSERPLISVIIPARNEAARLGRCLAGLATQSYPHFEVFVVDDHSSDGTGALARRYCGDLPHLSVIESAPLPDGWAGKSWACWQAAARANGVWLLFLDADVAPEPKLLTALAAEAERRAVDLLSVLPLVELQSTAERLVLPAFFELIAAIFPFERVNDPRSELAFAIGQCLLVRRSAYQAIGGHRVVRSSILEDMELAAVAKRSGRRLAAIEGPDHIRVRMYTGWQTVVEGLGKNAVAGFRNGAARSTGAALWQLALGWLPIDLLLAGALIPGADGQILRFAGVLLLLVGATIGVWTVRRRFRLTAIWGALLPLGTLLYFLIAARAALRLRRGLGVTWKGRVFTR